jgi:hypothetical protein
LSEVTVEKSWKIAPQGIGRRDYSQATERFDVEPTLLLFEDFTHLPLSWNPFGTGTVVRDTSKAWRGGACLKIAPTPPTNYAGYYQYFGLVPSMKLLLDARINFPATGAWFAIGIDRMIGTEAVWAEVLYSIPTRKWQYRNAAGAYIDIPGGAQELSNNVFHHMSISIDFLTEQYLYAQCNELFLDLKALKPWRRPIVSAPEAHVCIWAGTVVAGPEFFVGNVRVAEVI